MKKIFVILIVLLVPHWYASANDTTYLQQDTQFFTITKTFIRNIPDRKFTAEQLKKIGSGISDTLQVRETYITNHPWLGVMFGKKNTRAIIYSLPNFSIAGPPKDTDEKINWEATWFFLFLLFFSIGVTMLAILNYPGIFIVIFLFGLIIAIELAPLYWWKNHDLVFIYDWKTPAITCSITIICFFVAYIKTRGKRVR